MGYEITANGSSHCFRGGYGGFMSLREDIAKALDKEFGNHYATLSRCFREEDFDAFNKKANKILSDAKFNGYEDVLDFLYAPDCDGGKVSYKTCKKIYDLIKDFDFKGDIFTYAAHSDGKDYEHFKEFLLECYSHRRNMIWR